CRSAPHSDEPLLAGAPRGRSRAVVSRSARGSGTSDTSMCGIAGAVAFRDGGRPDRDRLCTMAGLMAHRGPDGEGFWADPRGRVALVHRRLSIIDIAGGRQPMCSDDGQIALGVNGEIYHYRELRRSLSDDGVQCHTASDTDVPLANYQRCLNAPVRTHHR